MEYRDQLTVPWVVRAVEEAGGPPPQPGARVRVVHRVVVRPLRRRRRRRGAVAVPAHAVVRLDMGGGIHCLENAAVLSLSVC